MADIVEKLREVTRYGMLNEEAAAEIVQLRYEIERLHQCLEKANRNHEHFERKWYLRGDEIEQLQDVLEVLVSNVEHAWPSLKHLDPVKNARDLLNKTKEKK